ncbi:Imm32 family immunity protein [Christiangramia sp. ASW11-125]|uniref:Imm32 family immunity protein n=1 Tax=Christiangramia sp. ASW11-125 TaxID=3400701 RepID=UPI003AAFE307
MLTFEYSNSDGKIEIHLDQNGIDQLNNILSSLSQESKSEHLHLMTKEWGGSELTQEKQNNSTDFELINHVKIMFWKD